MAFAATKRKRIKLKRKPMEQLRLTSLIDLMTVILIFLLQTYSAVEFQVTPSELLHLPQSVNTKVPVQSVQMIVAKNAILVEGVIVAKVDAQSFEIEGVAPQELIIDNVLAVLRKQSDLGRRRAERLGQEYLGEITIQAHKTIPYKLLVKALVTAGKAGFGDIKFMAYKVEKT